MKLQKDPYASFVKEVALLKVDGDATGELDEYGEPVEYEMENDDAWATLYRLIHEARALRDAPRWTVRRTSRNSVARLRRRRILQGAEQ